MLGPWTLGKFALSEATTLYQGLEYLTENEGLAGMEIVGKHPNVHEASTYKLNEDFPVFMDVSDSEEWDDEYAGYLAACNTFFSNMYQA